MIQSDDKSHVRTWGDIVHICLSDCSVCNSFWKYSVRFLWRGDILLCNVLQINAFGFILTYLHVSLWNIKEILDLLEVDLNHGYLDSKFDVRRLLWDFAEYLWDESWKDTFFQLVFIIRADTGEGFSRWGLSICKDCAVETFKCKVYNIFADFFINFLLSCLLMKDTIEGEFIFRFPVFNFDRLFC